jgi:D-glycero-alpha-D-manno-heptose 1-phosphate guanylyltransferase
MINEAIILAGGFGTRLREVLENTTKPMAPINGKPFLEFQLNYLKNFGINRVVMAVGYLSEQIVEHFQSSFNGIEIVYTHEENPLGTGGGIKFAFTKIKGKEAVVVNGDTLFDIDLVDFYKFHNSKRSNFSLALRQLDDVGRFGSVIIDKESKITEFAEKGQFEGKGLINGGVYIINADFFQTIDLPEKFSLENDVFEKYYKKGMFFGEVFTDYFLDIGIPSDYEKAQYDFRNFKY